MSDNNWQTQPRKSNGEFTYRVGQNFLKNLFKKVHEDLSIKKGGKYGNLKKITSGNKDLEIHHMPADSVSPLSTWNGPCIIMTFEDHRLTASYGNKKSAVIYRKKQLELIKNGKFFKAQMMDIKDIRKLFGSKYNQAIKEKVSYEKQLEAGGKV